MIDLTKWETRYVGILVAKILLNILLENIVQKNVANNLRNGTTIISTGIEFVLMYLKEIITHVKSAKGVIPILTEKNLPDHVG